MSRQNFHNNKMLEFINDNNESIVQSFYNIDILLENIAEQEYKICLIELGVI